MTLFDLVVAVGIAELFVAVAILAALVWPRQAGPRLTHRPPMAARGLDGAGPVAASPARKVIRAAPGAPPGAPVPGG
jgi:hypothetical protein